MTAIPLFPLPNTVVFPGVNLPLYIFEERYKQMIRDCIANQSPRIVIVLNPSSALNDGVPGLHHVGTYVDILQIAENLDGTFNIMAHGADRCKLQDIDSHSHPYYSAVCEKLPLKREDPNQERVLAWDALDTFRRYVDALFPKGSSEQIENAMPKDLLLQASFICVNLLIAPERKQVLLEAESLSARFQMADQVMLEQLASPPPQNELN